MWLHLRSQLDFLFGWYSFVILEHFLITHVLVTLWTHHTLLVLLYKITWDWVIFLRTEIHFLVALEVRKSRTSCQHKWVSTKGYCLFPRWQPCCLPSRGDGCWVIVAAAAEGNPSFHLKLCCKGENYIHNGSGLIISYQRPCSSVATKTWFHCVTQADFKLMALLPQSSQYWI